MKRSELNQILNNAKAFMAESHFMLPPWAYWSVADWKANKEDASEIIENMLGWDITVTENSTWTKSLMPKKS